MDSPLEAGATFEQSEIPGRKIYFQFFFFLKFNYIDCGFSLIITFADFCMQWCRSAVSGGQFALIGCPRRGCNATR